MQGEAPSTTLGGASDSSRPQKAITTIGADKECSYDRARAEGKTRPRVAMHASAAVRAVMPLSRGLTRLLGPNVERLLELMPSEPDIQLAL